MCLRRLILSSNVIPLARVRIRFRLSLPSPTAKRIKDTLLPLCVSIESEEWGEDWDLVAVIEPGMFKEVQEMVSKESKGKGVVEALATVTLSDS